MNKSVDFKWRHFQSAIILLCVRWYLKYPMSYRDLVDMMNERGLSITHTTIMRWVHQYAPEIDRRIRSKLRQTGDSWRVDETYVKVAGNWTYLYRAVDKEGNTLDFYLSEYRDTVAAANFLKKALDAQHTTLPRVINVDKAPSYPAAVDMAKAAGYLPECTDLRQVKFLNNIIEADHFPIKRLIKPGSGFGSFEGATKTIQGYEAMRMLKKKQVVAAGQTAASQAIFVNSLFGIAA